MEARSGIRRFLKMRKMFNSQLEEKLKTKVSSKFMWILNKSCVSHLTLDKLLNWLLRGLGLQGTIGLLRDVKPHISHDGWNIATSSQTIFSCLKIFSPSPEPQQGAVLVREDRHYHMSREHRHRRLLKRIRKRIHVRLLL